LQAIRNFVQPIFQGMEEALARADGMIEKLLEE
jgi:hypothetical protein